jgi:hypothetical protein
LTSGIGTGTGAGAGACCGAGEFVDFVLDWIALMRLSISVLKFMPPGVSVLSVEEAGAESSTDVVPGKS